MWNSPPPSFPMMLSTRSPPWVSAGSSGSATLAPPTPGLSPAKNDVRRLYKTSFSQSITAVMVMAVNMSLHMLGCVCVCVRVCVRAHTCLYVYLGACLLWLFIHMYLFLYVCLCVCVCTTVYIKTLIEILEIKLPNPDLQMNKP